MSTKHSPAWETNSHSPTKLTLSFMEPTLPYHIYNSLPLHSIPTQMNSSMLSCHISLRPIPILFWNQHTRLATVSSLQALRPKFCAHFLHTTCPTHLILICISPCHVQSAGLRHLDNEDSSWFPPSVRTVRDTSPVRSAKHMVCQQELVGCPILYALSCCLGSGLSAADQHSQVQEGASSLWLQKQQHKCYWKIRCLLKNSTHHKTVSLLKMKFPLFGYYSIWLLH